MIFLRFITVAGRTEDACAKRTNIVSLIVGSFSTAFLSVVANFPEGQSHGVGFTHQVSAGILFTGGCVFIIADTVVTLRTRYVDTRDANLLAIVPRQGWLRSIRWFECLRPILAVLSVLALLLCK